MYVIWLGLKRQVSLPSQSKYLMFSTPKSLDIYNHRSNIAKMSLDFHEVLSTIPIRMVYVPKYPHFAHNRSHNMMLQISISECLVTSKSSSYHMMPQISIGLFWVHVSIYETKATPNI